MRTAALVGFGSSTILVLALLLDSQVLVAMTMLTLVLCLVMLAKSSEALAFVQASLPRAILLELAMYATAGASVTLFANNFTWSAVLAALLHAACWYILIRFSESYSFYGEESIFDGLPEDMTTEE